MDDDVFFCLSEFLTQLPPTPLKHFHWGWVHCEKFLTRPEESVIMFSYDVIREFLNQKPNKLWCHPFADQMIAMWLEELDIGHILRHDYRIHHHPVVREMPTSKDRRYICRDYLAIHGSSPRDVLSFWKTKGNLGPKDLYSIDRLTRSCPSTFSFDWNSLGIWQYRPKKCITKPVWNTKKHQTKDGMYVGRLGSSINKAQREMNKKLLSNKVTPK